MSKIILTDCDGVLLEWMMSFQEWMLDRGYTLTHGNELAYNLNHKFEGVNYEQAGELCKIFNRSEEIGKLSAFRDSVEYVNKLYTEFGYKFRIITCIGTEPISAQLREQNLRNVFGDAIESVICLGVQEEKNEALAPYANSGMYWIEDKYSNFKAGVDIGLTGILVEHGFNQHEDTTGGFGVHSWKEIYDIIATGER